MSRGQRKPSREARTLALLRSNRNRSKPPYATIWPEGSGWVDLKELRIGAGAQHSARLKALRDRGHEIENWMEWNSVAGEMWSWYRLKYDAVPITETEPVVRTITQQKNSSTHSLFGDISPETARHRDDG
jgi:hypothetical protein